MTYTDHGTRCPHEWMPLAFANGVEWATLRKGHKDRWDNLYRRGLLQKALWFAGALTTLLHKPRWATN